MKRLVVALSLALGVFAIWQWSSPPEQKSPAPAQPGELDQGLEETRPLDPVTNPGTASPAILAASTKPAGMAAGGLELVGSVATPAGQPVPGLTLKLRSLTDGEPGTTITDAEGKFHVAHLKPGAYGIKALVGRDFIPPVEQFFELKEPVTKQDLVLLPAFTYRCQFRAGGLPGPRTEISFRFENQIISEISNENGQLELLLPHGQQVLVQYWPYDLPALKDAREPQLFSTDQLPSVWELPECGELEIIFEKEPNSIEVELCEFSGFKLKSTKARVKGIPVGQYLYYVNCSQGEIRGEIVIKPRQLTKIDFEESRVGRLLVVDELGNPIEGAYVSGSGKYVQSTDEQGYVFGTRGQSRLEIYKFGYYRNDIILPRENEVVTLQGLIPVELLILEATPDTRVFTGPVRHVVDALSDELTVIWGNELEIEQGKAHVLAPSGDLKVTRFDGKELRSWRFQIERPGPHQFLIETCTSPRSALSGVVTLRNVSTLAEIVAEEDTLCLKFSRRTHSQVDFAEIEDLVERDGLIEVAYTALLEPGDYHIELMSRYNPSGMKTIESSDLLELSAYRQAIAMVKKSIPKDLERLNLEFEFNRVAFEVAGAESISATLSGRRIQIPSSLKLASGYYSLFSHSDEEGWFPTQGFRVPGTTTVSVELQDPVEVELRGIQWESNWSVSPLNSLAVEVQVISKDPPRLRWQGELGYGVLEASNSLRLEDTPKIFRVLKDGSVEWISREAGGAVVVRSSAPNVRVSVQPLSWDIPALPYRSSKVYQLPPGRYEVDVTGGRNNHFKGVISIQTGETTIIELDR